MEYVKELLKEEKSWLLLILEEGNYTDEAKVQIEEELRQVTVVLGWLDTNDQRNSVHDGFEG